MASPRRDSPSSPAAAAAAVAAANARKSRDETLINKIGTLARKKKVKEGRFTNKLIIKLFFLELGWMLNCSHLHVHFHFVLSLRQLTNWKRKEKPPSNPLQAQSPQNSRQKAFLWRKETRGKARYQLFIEMVLLQRNYR